MALHVGVAGAGMVESACYLYFMQRLANDLCVHFHVYIYSLMGIHTLSHLASACVVCKGFACTHYLSRLE